MLLKYPYSTKIAIKMSRVSDKHKDNFIEQEDSIDSDISEEDEDTDDADAEETPDLYRNSSLGMYVNLPVYLYSMMTC